MLSYGYLISKTHHSFNNFVSCNYLPNYYEYAVFDDFILMYYFLEIDRRQMRPDLFTKVPLLTAYKLMPGYTISKTHLKSELAPTPI